MNRDEDATTERLAERLGQRFPGVAPDTVAVVVRATHQQFEHQPIQQFTPLLVENLARKRLSQVRREASLKGQDDKPDPLVSRQHPAAAATPPDPANRHRICG